MSTVQARAKSKASGVDIFYNAVLASVTFVPVGQVDISNKATGKASDGVCFRLDGRSAIVLL